MACRGSAGSPYYGWAAHTSSNACRLLSHLHLATPLGWGAKNVRRRPKQGSRPRNLGAMHCMRAFGGMSQSFDISSACRPPHYQCSLNSGGLNENQMKKKVEGPEALDICILCSPWAASQPRPKPHHIRVNSTLILVGCHKLWHLKGPSEKSVMMAQKA